RRAECATAGVRAGRSQAQRGAGSKLAGAAGRGQRRAEGATAGARAGRSQAQRGAGRTLAGAAGRWQ
ncbi:MAG: hypothetical protein LBL86_09620, partial [Coriobacteriales bacterium]|nr:hypothetical protein [Coriobacteriales bacterium]